MVGILDRHDLIGRAYIGPVVVEIETAVLALDAVKLALRGKAVRKVIVVPKRIVNVVG